MRAAVIVLAWNGGADLAACLAAVQAQQGAEAELLVIDNGSADRSVALVRERFPGVALVENGRNLGFSAGMNVGLRLLAAARRGERLPGGLRLAAHDYVVLLNQDTLVAPDWLRNILAPLAEPQVGAVGCKIYYPDGQTIQHAGKLVEPGRAMTRHYGYHQRDQGQYDQPRDLESVTGAALALRFAALDQVGLLDQGYSPAYFEDDDLCWRLRRAGYLVRYEPRATLRHAESRSIVDVVRRSTLMNRNRLRFVVKTFPAERIWGDFWVAERARMAVINGSSEARTLRRAYLEGSLRAEEWLGETCPYLPLPDSWEARLRGLCQALRQEMAVWDRARIRHEP